jgi:hypothetical protein
MVANAKIYFFQVRRECITEKIEEFFHFISETRDNNESTPSGVM